MTNFGCDSQTTRAFTPTPKQAKEIRPTWIHHLGKESKPIQKTHPSKEGFFLPDGTDGIGAFNSIIFLPSNSTHT